MVCRLPQHFVPSKIFPKAKAKKLYILFFISKVLAQILVSFHHHTVIRSSHHYWQLQGQTLGTSDGYWTLLSMRLEDVGGLLVSFSLPPLCLSAPSLPFPTDFGVADILCHKIICVVPVCAAHVSHCWETNTAPPDAGLVTSCCCRPIKNCGDTTT